MCSIDDMMESWRRSCFICTSWGAGGVMVFRAMILPVRLSLTLWTVLPSPRRRFPRGRRHPRTQFALPRLVLVSSWLTAVQKRTGHCSEEFEPRTKSPQVERNRRENGMRVGGKLKQVMHWLCKGYVCQGLCSSPVSLCFCSAHAWLPQAAASLDTRLLPRPCTTIYQNKPRGQRTTWP
jgi:hypothetical protein